MLNFSVDESRCTRCGKCIADCPVRIIAFNEAGLPAISEEKAKKCLKCQHCLAICPTAAIAILGHQPKDSRQLSGQLPGADQLATLIKGRRSVRRYQASEIPPEPLRELLHVAWHAPTGVNARGVQFHVVDSQQAMAGFRQRLMEALAQLVAAQQLPQNRQFFADFVGLWQEGVDMLCRQAPHLVLASAPEQDPTPREDCLIALSYLELYAQTQGISTLWNGLIYWALTELVPQLQGELGIPDNHILGYAMLLGYAEDGYQRTVEHGPAAIRSIAL